EVEMVRREYEANGGKEIFLSMEDTKNDVIVGYCRLRFPFAPHRPEVGENDAIVRELRVSGSLVPIGKKAGKEWQHRGYGKQLLGEAEEIAREAGKEKILVLSGIGVREYYRKLGYGRDGIYMSKSLD
ncbi:MAG TPA: GNAT family N-acetyltransferase, partial [Thermoplasmatales archaeon]|nr:GNAT family N-acetyltransferase [Thermoplasmatales archaeon]